MLQLAGQISENKIQEFLVGLQNPKTKNLVRYPEIFLTFFVGRIRPLVSWVYHALADLSLCSRFITFKQAKMKASNKAGTWENPWKSHMFFWFFLCDSFWRVLNNLMQIMFRNRECPFLWLFCSIRLPTIIVIVHYSIFEVVDVRCIDLDVYCTNVIVYWLVC